MESESTEWAPDFPSLVLGMLIGIFLTILGFKIVEHKTSQTMTVETPTVEKTEKQPFVFEFYELLMADETFPADER